MSVLIKCMEKPENCGYCRFRYDGICHALQKTQYSMDECPLVVIDDAGLNDTISRQKAIDAIANELDMIDHVPQWVSDRLVNALRCVQSIDAVKHGIWIEENTRPRSSQFYCSVCHRTAYDPQPTRIDGWVKRCRYAYCPNCGARMDGEENETN